MAPAPTFFQRCVNIAVLPGDTADDRAKKRLQVLLAWASVPMIGLWASTFHVAGRLDLAAWPYGYCVVTLAMIGHLAVTKNYAFFREAHLAWVMLAPYLFHIRLGGFFGSGAAILWSVFVPVAALMFLGPQRSVRWFAVLFALLLLSSLREFVFPGDAGLDRRFISIHFLINTIGTAAFCYFGNRYFVSKMEQERERAESLLRNILPAIIAERLKKGPEVIADSYDEVTVLFSDIVGFTVLSQSVSPEQLVRMLNDVFREFDALALALGVEKIKTIGDAYMVASGIPESRPDHAAAAAKMALGMVEIVERLATDQEHPLSMRIGLHTGPVVAGVIGTHKFAYDLWGDTVNTASRMESHGEAGRVQVSQATRDALGEAFSIERRGEIEVKGKGSMTTYWLAAAKE